MDPAEDDSEELSDAIALSLLLTCEPSTSARSTEPRAQYGAYDGDDDAALPSSSSSASASLPRGWRTHDSSEYEPLDEFEPEPSGRRWYTIGPGGGNYVMMVPGSSRAIIMSPSMLAALMPGMISRDNNNINDDTMPSMASSSSSSSSSSSYASGHVDSSAVVAARQLIGAVDDGSRFSTREPDEDDSIRIYPAPRSLYDDDDGDDDDDDAPAGSPDSIPLLRKDASEEAQNTLLTKWLHRSFSARFEDSALMWECGSCTKPIEGCEEHWVCDECDDLVLCDGCFADGQGEMVRIHQETAAKAQLERCRAHGLPDDALRHVGGFYYREARPRWHMKSRVGRARSTAEVVELALLGWRGRPLLGEAIEPQRQLHAYHKEFGVEIDGFRWYNFEHVAAMVKRLGHAFESYGFEAGVSHIAIAGENRLEWLVTDICCVRQALTSVALPHNITTADVSHILRTTEVHAVIATNSCLQQLIPALPACSTPVSLIVSMDEVLPEQQELLRESYARVGVEQLPPFVSFAFLLELGSAMEEDLGIIDQDSSNVATIMFTSGSSGVPKGVQFTEAQWLSQLKLPVTFKNVVMFGYLPLDHVAGRLDAYTAVFNGGRIAFDRSIFLPLNPGADGAHRVGTIVRRIRTLRPTVLGLIPLLANAIYQQYKLALRQALGDDDDDDDDDNESDATRLAIKARVRKQFRYVLGDRVTSLKVTSGPVSAAVRRFLRRVLGCVAHEGYGSTEVGSISTDGNVTQVVKLVSVPELGYLVSNDPPQGEILVQRARMSSYTDHEATNAAFRGQWFCTGDIGERTGEHSLRVIDRKSNVIKLANGEFVALERLERLFASECALVRQLLLHADSNKSNLVAIVVPTSETVDGTSEQERGTPEYRAAFERRVRQAFHDTAVAHSLRGFEIPIDLAIDWEVGEWNSSSGLLTNSNKLCRRNLRQRYARQIDALYTRQSILATLQIDSSSAAGRSFVELGGDSLTAMQVLEKLKRQSVNVSFEDLMGDASIDQLLGRSTSRYDDTALASPIVDISYELDKLAHLIEGFAWYKPAECSVPFVAKEPAQVSNIFLTGATGFLGGVLLEQLLEQYPGATVHCLVRRAGSLTQRHGSRVVEIVGNLSKGLFGMAPLDFMRLSNALDLVVHAGAIVNHLVSYDDLYQTNVGSTFEILKLALMGRIKPVHYVSSISAAKSACMREQGYSATKWAADRLFLHCRTEYHLPVSVYRPVLIIGHSLTGRANRKDWFHRLLQAIVDYRIVPPLASISNERISMVSADYCAQAIARLMLRHEPTSPAPSQGTQHDYVYHLAFANASFRDVFEMLLADNNPLQLHELPSHDEWFSQLETRVVRDNHPLLPFLKSFRHSLSGSSRSYDTTSLEAGLEQVRTQASVTIPEFSVLRREELLRTIEFLQSRE